MEAVGGQTETGKRSEVVVFATRPSYVMHSDMYEHLSAENRTYGRYEEVQSKPSTVYEMIWASLEHLDEHESSGFRNGSAELAVRDALRTYGEETGRKTDHRGPLQC